MRLPTSLAALLALAVALAACGGGSSKPKATATVTGAPQATTTSSTPAADATSTAGGPPAVTGAPTVTASGLQIIDIAVGDGDEAKAASTVTFNYTGWLEDGTKFDASADHGGPATYPLSSLIPGWQEGIPGMKAGGKRRLIIPPALGYGANGTTDGSVPPNATITFDIELLTVQ